MALSNLELMADGLLRSRHFSPFVFEYRSWSADYFIQWDMDSFVPSNLQPKVIPWREGCFSDRFSEWAAALEWRFLYARVSFTQSKKAFGILQEVSPSLEGAGSSGADCFYGTLGSSCDLGINFLFNRWVGGEIDVSPFIGAFRLRQGVFFNDIHSIYRSLTMSSDQLERMGKKWPSLFWDCVRIGLSTSLRYAQLVLKGDCSFCPLAYSNTAGMELNYWDFFGTENATYYQVGLAYQISVHMPIHSANIGIGRSYWSFDADILLPALQTRQEGEQVIFSASDQYVRGTLKQTFSGFFVQFNYAF